MDLCPKSLNLDKGIFLFRSAISMSGDPGEAEVFDLVT
jgi:hypothetical protein